MCAVHAQGVASTEVILLGNDGFIYGYCHGNNSSVLLKWAHVVLKMTNSVLTASKITSSNPDSDIDIVCVRIFRHFPMNTEVQWSGPNCAFCLRH
jgi:hypothetical protein